MSQFVEVKTAELTGNALRWVVGRAEGLDVRSTRNTVWVKGKVPHTGNNDDYYDPLCWAQGGPLIDKHNIWLSGPIGDRKEWSAAMDLSTEEMRGETALIALCRTVVAAKLGDVVQVPVELAGVAE